MQIESIIIKNLKSIKDQIIKSKKKFNILLGSNRSGKSNIIQATEILNKRTNNFKYWG